MQFSSETKSSRVCMSENVSEIRFQATSGPLLPDQVSERHDECKKKSCLCRVTCRLIQTLFFPHFCFLFASILFDSSDTHR